MDDVRATRDALAYEASLEVLKTQDLMVKAIVEDLISTDECDQIKNLWETEHRFTLKFGSFAELVGNHLFSRRL